MLKDYLAQINKSIYALSKETGVSYSMLNDLANGKTSVENMCLGHALAISKALGTGLDELIEICRNSDYFISTNHRVPCQIMAKNKAYYLLFEYKQSPVTLRLCKVNRRNSEYIRSIADWEADRYITSRRMEEF